MVFLISDLFYIVFASIPRGPTCVVLFPASSSAADNEDSSGKRRKITRSIKHKRKSVRICKLLTVPIVSLPDNSTSVARDLNLSALFNLLF